MRGRASPTLTFAIPCHDGERFLRPLLESLLAQSAACRLLLVDDASADDSVGVAQRVAGDAIEVVRNPRPLGIPANWSRCAALVQSEFFCLAHQDDVYAPEFVETLLTALAAAPEAAVAHCRAQAIDEDGQPLRSLRERYKNRFWRTLPSAEDAAAGFRRLFAGNYVCCPTLVYRTAAFAAIGAFDAHFRFVPDWEWLLRAHAKGWSFAAVPDQLVSYRRHTMQATQPEVRSLRRYREEQVLLAQAQAVGVGVGFLSGEASSTAMRDNLLFDAFNDLQACDRDEVWRKLDLLGELDPQARRGWPARALAGAARLGWPGRKAMALAVGAWVAWQAR